MKRECVFFTCSSSAVKEAVTASSNDQIVEENLDFFDRITRSKRNFRRTSFKGGAIDLFGYD